MFRPEDWTDKRELNDRVTLLKAKDDRKQPRYIVKKILNKNINGVRDKRPREIQRLERLPKCPRIVHPLTWVAPNVDELGTAIFEYYPEGDVAQWMDHRFSKTNPVPEDNIWRFFLQMVQALAFVHGDIPPGQTKPGIMMHRDIKPPNILVTYNGTKYPSFKLCDFELAAVWTIDSKNEQDVIGTLEWQPPENPKINTKAADVWSLGACVQFLATGENPVARTAQNRERCWTDIARCPEMMMRYRTEDQYYAARLPRRVIPINLDKKAQLRLSATGPIYHQYSDELYDWMSRCMHTARENRPTTAVLLHDMRNVAQEKLKKTAWEDMELTF